MSVERLFFGQKYVVFWAKHLISILGIRFGGSRDEILTFGIAIRVITPPTGADIGARFGSDRRVITVAHLERTQL